MNSFHSARLWWKDFFSVFVMVGVRKAKRTEAPGLEAARGSVARPGDGGAAQRLRRRTARPRTTLRYETTRTDCAAPCRAAAGAAGA